MEFYKIANNFLYSSGVKVSQKYLRERLESHPHYPSLISLTDILDEFQVENHPLRIKEKEKWKELNLPFLAHTISKDGAMDFELIKGHGTITSTKEFLDRWTGIALILGDKNKIVHKEHNNQYKKERKETNIIWLLVSLTTLFLVFSQLISGESVLVIHMILSVIGLAISCVIVAHGMGLNSNITELFCKVQESGCNAVLNSKLGNFGGIIGLGDLAAIFFCSSVLYLAFSMFFTTIDSAIFLLSINILAFFFTPISIIYQFHLKSWCKLCLALILVIWFQTANLIWYSLGVQSILSAFSQIPLNVYLLFGLSILLASFWIVVKPLKIKENEMLHQKIRIRKWRQNPTWFDALLPLHKKIDDSIWDKEIYYGNPSGVLQIIVVSSPYCVFCARAHSELDAILEKHPNDIGVRIRFTIKSLEKGNENYKALLNILGTYDEIVWKNNLESYSKPMKSIISDWYKKQNLSSWRNVARNINQKEVDVLIKKSVHWASEAGINQTPAFFINGHEMPNPHTFKDLFLFISDYIEILKNKKIQFSSEDTL